MDSTDEKTEIPEQSKFSVTSIHRGVKGDIGSGNDALSIKFTARHEPEKKKGFIFFIIQKGDSKSAISGVETIQSQTRTVGDYLRLTYLPLDRDEYRQTEVEQLNQSHL